MPQTLEHLHILDLLDVRRGAAVVTKTDVVVPDRVDAVAAEVRQALAGTSLHGAPMFQVSAQTGEGLSALQEWLHGATTEEASPEDDGRHFRMPVDRAFTVAGSGTVVTGTIASGSVAVGDHLVVSPSGKQVRVRAVQVQGRPAARACTAKRCALNLSGVGVDDVGRGDWVVHADVHAPTSRIDARLKVLASEAHALEHWTPVHLHLGTADVLARIGVPGEGSIAPGTSSLVQLVLHDPIAALNGDRFVVRDQAARRTIGGGVVLDPFAPRRKRRAGLRHAELQAMERATPAQILTGLLEIAESGVDLQAVTRSLNLTSERAAALQRDAQAVALGKDRPVAISRAAADLLAARIVAALREFHALHPQSTGQEAAALRRAVAPQLPAAAFQAFVRELANRGTIVLSNDLARLREHEATANAEDEELWRRVQGGLVRAG
ncbi:MAG: selenocysteine-specific translation factor, partial [Comamonadaceae bacterium]